MTYVRHTAMRRMRGRLVRRSLLVSPDMRGYDIPGDSGPFASQGQTGFGFSLKPPKWLRKASVAVRRNVTLKRTLAVAGGVAAIALAPVALPAIAAGARFIGTEAAAAGRGILGLFNRGGGGLIGPPAPPGTYPCDPGIGPCPPSTYPSASPPPPVSIPGLNFPDSSAGGGYGGGGYGGGGGGGVPIPSEDTGAGDTSVKPAPAGISGPLGLALLGLTAVYLLKGGTKGGRRRVLRRR